MAGVAGKDRDQRGFPVEETTFKRQDKGESLRVPGDGDVTVPLEGFDGRSAQHHAGAMQGWIPGGTAAEHQYMTKHGKKQRANPKTQRKMP